MKSLKFKNKSNSASIVEAIRGFNSLCTAFSLPLFRGGLGGGFLLFCMSISAFAQFSGGAGTSEDPYIITTAPQLAQLATLVNAGNETYNEAYYKLGNDIDLSAYGASFNDGKGWIAIGKNVSGFLGAFDGNQKTVTGLFIDDDNAFSVGLFGYKQGNSIENLYLEGVNINGREDVGGIVGVATIVQINQCYVTGSINGYKCVGGVVGRANSNSVITRCYSTGTVSGNQWIGGIAGSGESATNINNCYSLSTVIGAGSYIGGIVGLFWTSTISNCYSAGEVSGLNWVGGVIGNHGSSSGRNLENCAALNPRVAGYYETIVGRLVGTSDAILINNVGFEYMLNYNENTTWENKGLDQVDGADISRATINADGTIGGRFTSVDGWTVENGKLPGLFGNAIDMPAHLIPEPETPPVIITTDLPDGITDEYYEVALSATGTLPITWTVVSGTLPSDLQISTNGVISGTPYLTGTFAFTVKVTNLYGANEKEFEIKINAAAVAPEITTASLPEGAVGATYFQTIEASGTTPITWSITNGALPNGLSLNANTGVISGKPTTADKFMFDVLAVNVAGSNSKSFEISIQEGDTPPVITTTTLPNGEINAEYYAVLSATGTKPITWSISSGALPTGLNLSEDGIISGIPTELEWFNFTVKAVNSTGEATKLLSIYINTVGIENQLGIRNYELRVYPNPTRGELRIENGELRIDNVDIFDISGKTVGGTGCISPAGGGRGWTSSNSNEIKLDISHLPSGIYILKINNQLIKIVKK